ncbi:MAG: DUF2061 domain-containing protein [Burkholderiaceae bacterium]|nr:DUF2061 domain-containing protein [Burkholderiaceae bacterium]
MAKSAAFGVIHLGISFSIGWALTGSVAIAGAITLVEPVANTVAHYFFDRWWARRVQNEAPARRGRWLARLGGIVGFGSQAAPALAPAALTPRP